MLKIKNSRKFEQDFEELVIDDGELEYLIRDKIKLFENKPDDTRLKNHALKKKMKGQHAFSITDDIRIIYKWTGKKTVRFLAIGPHGRVYKKSQ